MTGKRRRTRIVNGALIAVLLLAGGLVYYGFVDVGGSSSANVRTVAATKATVNQSVSAGGTLESATSATAAFRSGGTVSAVLVKVGDQVTKGQALARIEPGELGSKVDIAADQMAAAKLNLTSAQLKLTDTVNTGKESFQQQGAVKQGQAAYKQAVVNYNEAKKAVADTTLTAPITGTVVKVNGEVGQSASGGTSVASSAGTSAGTGTGSGVGGSSSSQSAAGGSSGTGFVQIADLTGLRVRANFAEVDVAELKVEQTGEVTLNAVPGQPVAARVTAIDPIPTTSNSVVTYGATLSVDHLPDGARIGQTVSVSVTVASVSEAVVVPAAAVQTNDDQTMVTVLRDGRQERRVIELGVKGDSTVQVTNGLTEGDRVMLRGVTTSGNTGRGGTGGGFPGSGPGGGGFPGGGAGRVPGGN